MPSYNILDVPGTSLLLAARALSFLRRITPYVLTGATEWDARQFEQGSTISLHMGKQRGPAESYDPYTLSDANRYNPEDVVIQLTLENLFTDAFNVFASDANVARYVQTNAQSSANSVGIAVENYFYEKCFLDLTAIPSTGTYSFDGDPPLVTLWREDASGNLLEHSRNLLYTAQAVQDELDVPPTDRWALTKPSGFTDYFVGAPSDEAESGALVGGPEVLANGIPMGNFIARGGYNFGKSNAVQSQTALADIQGGSPTVAITSVADDTTLFFDGTYHSSFPTPIGAIEFTTLALTSGVNELAVGDIIRVGPTGGTATGYGRVIRISPARTETYAVIYNSKGEKLVAADINTGTDLISSPLIPKINTAHHREFLSYAFRSLMPPSQNSGVTQTMMLDEPTGMNLMILTGDYNIDRFNEGVRSAVLCGAKPTDYRKALLLLTA